MKVGLVGLHYPRAEYREEFVARVQHAAEVIRSTAGCLSVDCWVSAAGVVVVSTAQWETRDAMARVVHCRRGGWSGLRLRRAGGTPPRDPPPDIRLGM